MLRFVHFLWCLLVVAAYGEPEGQEFLVRGWQSDEGLPGSVVRSVGQTSDGVLWVATAEGLARFDGIEFRTIPLSGNVRGLTSGFVRIYTPSDSSVWVSTAKGGLLRVREGRLELMVEDSDTEAAATLITQVVSIKDTVYFARQKEVWSLSPDGPRVNATPPADVLAKIADDATKEARRGRTPDPRLMSRLIDRRHRIWNIEGGHLTFKPTEESPFSQRIPGLGDRLIANDLLEDLEGNLWIASPVQGLIRVRSARVRQITTDQGRYLNPAKTAVQTRDATWWIASRNGGLDRIQNGTLDHWRVTPHGEDRQISCLFVDRSDRLWICTQEGSVYQRVDQRLEPRFAATPSLSQILTMTEDDDGRLWFGGRRGLFRWDGAQVEDFNNDPILSGKEFSTLAVDSRGLIYAGTADGLVITFDGRSFDSLGEVGDDGRCRISAILPRPDGEVWVSTIGSGLWLRHDGSWSSFGKEAGLPDLRLTSLFHAKDGLLWMGSLAGILASSRDELLRWKSSPDHIPRWLRLDRSDGMPTRECSGASQPGSFLSSDGILWFPTNAGLAGVQPDHISINGSPPSVQFEPVVVNGALRSVGQGPITAGPGRSLLEFGFTGISLTAPEKVTYRVKLSGIEEESRFLGAQRKVTYAAVPPGNYTFEVYAVNGDGIATVSPSLISIHVLPHFWETAWFGTAMIITALLVALGIGWLVARRRAMRKIAALRLKSTLEAERSRISRDLHDDIGASLTELSMRCALTAENPDDSRLRPSLGDLARSAKHVVHALDEIVWATNPTKDSLSSLVEYLAFFARRFLDAVDVPLHSDIQRQFPDLMIGPRRRHNVVLATREALNNAVKHAQPRRVSLKIFILDRRLVVQIEDDGKGFIVGNSGQGNGLGNLHKRMTDCGGDCRIESEPGAGTSVTLSLPLPG